MEHNDDRVQREIEELLRQKIGLNPQSVGARSIVRAVKRGMRVGKMQALSDYLAGLQSSDALFEALVESIVVPETSFFRNRASFVFLRQWISQEWSKITQKKSLKRPLRVLSIPCSTGEEPYSIAITLLEEALKPNEFQIDAVDISEQALEKAKQGVYSPYAFRR
ncbi:MAG: CheR family methyltransferase, partial [Cyanobacteria bacterium J06553_1]